MHPKASFPAYQVNAADTLTRHTFCVRKPCADHGVPLILVFGTNKNLKL